MSSIVVGRRVFAAMFAAFALMAMVCFLANAPQQAQTIYPADQSILISKFRGEDDVTRQVRNESTVLSRVDIRSAEDREKAGRMGKVVQDYGSFIIVARSTAAAARQFGLEEQVIETTVNLPGARFEPLKQAPAGSLRLGRAATSNGKGYYILQFAGTPTDEWMKSIRVAGVEILQYIPHHAYFVFGEADAIARVADHSRVRWIGSYLPEHKLSSNLKAQLDSARRGRSLRRSISPVKLTKQGSALFDISVFARADVDSVAADIAEKFGSSSVRVERLRNNFFNVIRAELSLNDIESVAALPDIVDIEAVGETRNEDERSAQILAGNYFNPTTIQGPGYNPLAQFGTDGSDVTVSVVDDGVGIPGDGGFYITSANAATAPLRGAQPGAFGHGHLNATIIAGSTPFGPVDSLFYNFALGVAPKAHIVSVPRNRAGYTGTDAEVYNDAVVSPGPTGRLPFISNNSWGSGLNGNEYGTMERKFDGFVQDASEHPGIAPVALIFSAGNEGVNGFTRPKAAKNLISVGNSESLRTDLGGASANNIDDIASNSSRGPTADGRIKPDLVAPGTAITGGRSGTDSLSGNLDSVHRWSSGTSHSAAQITGAAALFASRWRVVEFGDQPSPSLIKAALINAAVDMNGEGASAPIPNGNEGWGRPNLKYMFNTGVGMKYVDEPFALQSTGEIYQLEGSVADGSKPLRVTVAWTDPPGVADPALVNNLDLSVFVNGVEYKGNVFSNGISITGGAADTRNNVESVFLPAGIPTGSALRIVVRATALNGDGVLLNGDDTDQHHSIVVYNWSGIVGQTVNTVSGRIRSSSNRGVAFARVRLVDSEGRVRETMSNPLGYFTFRQVLGGQTYTISVASKRYSFTSRQEVINSDITNLDFASNESP